MRKCIIHLDYDGVLNASFVEPIDLVKNTFYRFDAHCVESFKNLLKAIKDHGYDPKVVINTSWRQNFSHEKMKDPSLFFRYTFDFVGLDPDLILECSPKHSDDVLLSKAINSREALKKHPKHSHLILDDMVYEERYTEIQIVTQDRYGLTDEHIPEALLILDKNINIRNLI